ncbi:MAG: hypothetical protein ACREPC_09630 [Stenotrophomonas sp.]|uniref:hypothetical protein n=1 Tax=Stenotrophomonas sp. TaxID=69392 RepID=UPI003D6DA2BA
MKGRLCHAAPLGLLLLSLTTVAHARQDSMKAPPACLSRAEITAAVTPAAMMAALPRCVQEGRTQDAIDLYNISGVFAHFDRQRVADQSAHGAYQAMKMAAGSAMDEETLARFDTALKAQLAPDKAPAYVAGICTDVKRLGPPTYTPTYMLSHGMSNFTGTGGGLVPDFKPAEAWKTTLTQYLKCPA